MKHDLDYMIAVMQAAKDGKEIEYLSSDKNKWIYVKKPIWNWHYYDFRIKPEPPKPEYVPYESAEEFFQAQKEHGLYLKGNYGCYFPVFVDDGGISIVNGNREVATYLFNDEDDESESLHNVLTWQDGTPCGKPKQIS